MGLEIAGWDVFEVELQNCVLDMSVCGALGMVDTVNDDAVEGVLS